MMHWTPMQRASLGKMEITEADLQRQMEVTGQDRETALKVIEHELGTVEYFVNDLYQVAKRQCAPNSVFNHTDYHMVQLNIRRRDGRPIFRDWRHFQQIKNELIGPECEAVEIYPAESRLSDESNKYHLFAFVDPDLQIPFGMFLGRQVHNEKPGETRPGFRQRKL